MIGKWFNRLVMLGVVLVIFVSGAFLFERLNSWGVISFLGQARSSVVSVFEGNQDGGWSRTVLSEEVVPESFEGSGSNGQKDEVNWAEDPEVVVSEDGGAVSSSGDRLGAEGALLQLWKFETEDLPKANDGVTWFDPAPGCTRFSVKDVNGKKQEVTLSQFFAQEAQDNPFLYAMALSLETHNFEAARQAARDAVAAEEQRSVLCKGANEGEDGSLVCWPEVVVGKFKAHADEWPPEKCQNDSTLPPVEEALAEGKTVADGKQSDPAAGDEFVDAAPGGDASASSDAAGSGSGDRGGDVKVAAPSGSEGNGVNPIQSVPNVPAASDAVPAEVQSLEAQPQVDFSAAVEALRAQEELQRAQVAQEAQARWVEEEARLVLERLKSQTAQVQTPRVPAGGLSGEVYQSPSAGVVTADPAYGIPPQVGYQGYQSAPQGRLPVVMKNPQLQAEWSVPSAQPNYAAMPSDAGAPLPQPAPGGYVVDIWHVGSGGSDPRQIAPGGQLAYGGGGAQYNSQSLTYGAWAGQFQVQPYGGQYAAPSAYSATGGHVPNQPAYSTTDGGVNTGGTLPEWYTVAPQEQTVLTTDGTSQIPPLIDPNAYKSPASGFTIQPSSLSGGGGANPYQVAPSGVIQDTVKIP